LSVIYIYKITEVCLTYFLKGNCFNYIYWHYFDSYRCWFECKDARADSEGESCPIISHYHRYVAGTNVPSAATSLYSL